jgi:hypothetical protein
MKRIIFSLIAAVVFTYFGWQLTDKGLSSPSDESLKEYEQLCKRSVKTIGFLDSAYTETTIKIIKGSSGTKMNKFTFTFMVDGETHTGSYTTSGMPKKPIVDVWYDPSNPSSYITNDPCAQYEYSKGKKHPRWYAILGVPMLLLGAGSLYSMLKRGLKGMMSGGKK